MCHKQRRKNRDRALANQIYIYIYIWSDSDWKDVIALHKEPMWPALLGGSTFSTGTGGFNLWNLGRQL